MKKLVFLSAFCAALSVSAAVLDGIAAKVNDQTITIGEVMSELRRSPENAEKLRNADEATARAIYGKALDSLIERKLILTSAAGKKMEMQEWVVDNRVREIVKDNFGGDRNKLEAELTARKIPFAEWRNVIREDLILAAMRFQTIEKNAVATPGAMRQEYNAHKANYSVAPKVSVSVILLKPGEANAPAVSTRGAEIVDRLAKGESFAALASKYSADSHAQDGGLWKDVDPEESFRPEIAEAIGSLRVGENSKLIDLDGWGFIVRKESESVGGERSFAEAYDDVARTVKANWAKKAYADWIDRLRAAAFVKKYPMPDEN